jgi:hypothetical protein
MPQRTCHGGRGGKEVQMRNSRSPLALAVMAAVAMSGAAALAPQPRTVSYTSTRMVGPTGSKPRRKSRGSHKQNLRRQMKANRRAA